MDAEKPVMTERSKVFSQTARVVLVTLLMATALAGMGSTLRTLIRYGYRLPADRRLRIVSSLRGLGSRRPCKPPWS